MIHIDTRAQSTQPVRVTQTRTSPIPCEDALASETETLLRQIGAVLDFKEAGSLRVLTRGEIISIRDEPQTKKDSSNERQRKRRPTAGTRQRPAGWQGAPGGSRPSGTAPRFGSELRNLYEGQIGLVREAYPSLQVVLDKDGMWLLAKSMVLRGLTREATFLIAIPYRHNLLPRAWGFWTAFGKLPTWIGPRHSNFGDGSICAFAPQDDVWQDGGDLTTLIDLYSVWALRHLHLEVLGRWPGKQYTLLGTNPALEALYRLSECKDDELCGCGSETLRYRQCCKPKDQKWDRLELIRLFMAAMPGGFSSRRPPGEVVAFIDGRAPIPALKDVYIQLRALD